MKQSLLFAIAILLGSVAFAQQVPPGICEFFSYPNWQPVSLRGCHSCPVRENGKLVMCEEVLAPLTKKNTTGQSYTVRNCCWLNTPPRRPVTDNCYTNAYVLPGTPWAARCVELLDSLANPGKNGGRGGAKGGAKVNKKTTVNKPAGSVVTPSKSAPEKQTPLQPSSKKTSK